MSTTRIEWATHVWNPVSGCDRVSEGCRNCYAAGFARRHRAMGTRGYQRDGRPETSGPGFGVTLHDWTLNLPLRWRTGRRVFVNSMSDAFHPEVPDEYLAALWAVMYWTGADVRGSRASKPVQTYIVLTKRPPRMRAWLKRWADIPTRIDLIKSAAARGWCDQEDIEHAPFMPTALSSVWLGVSVEDQAAADARVPLLMQTPAAVRCVSAEPLLGPVDLSRWLRPALDCGFADPSDGCCTHPDNPTPECHRWVNCPAAPAAGGRAWTGSSPAAKAAPGPAPCTPSGPALSGPSAPPPACRSSTSSGGNGRREPTPSGAHGPAVLIDPQGRTHSPDTGAPAPAGWARMARYGKKRAGSALDGEHYEQLPGHYTHQHSHTPAAADTTTPPK
ncbi:hypothetical protein SVIO_112180 [Streptomyces violaceusniger]|uniref:Gp37Gp68 family protein n=1 Tax=Streptomyces violaceusniger TaxID=68280 RepID=A0A4D4LI15_STRVO|nr:hypothetical protein SVIO_112180 [Streptomyces violaceusniger]